MKCTLNNLITISLTWVLGDLPCFVRQDPALHIHMVFFFLKQCITARCNLVNENFFDFIGFGYYLEFGSAFELV